MTNGQWLGRISFEKVKIEVGCRATPTERPGSAADSRKGSFV